jgi:hypothetical protein
MKNTRYGKLVATILNSKETIKPIKFHLHPHLIYHFIALKSYFNSEYRFFYYLFLRN